MKEEKRLIITVSSEDAQKIITEAVEKRMKDQGYEIFTVKCDEGPYPETIFVGEA